MIWDWALPVDGDFFLAMLGSYCQGEEFIYQLDTDWRNFRYELDSCMIVCKPSPGLMQMQARFTSPSSGNQQVAFNADNQTNVLLELYDVNLEWISGILDHFSGDISGSWIIPSPGIEYDNLLFSRFILYLEVDNPHPQGGELSLAFYGQESDPVRILFPFGRGANNTLYDEDDLDLLRILKHPPDSIKTEGTITIGDGNEAAKWFLQDPVTIQAELTLPLSFAADETMTFRSKIDSIFFEEDAVDLSNPEFNKVELIAIVFNEIPAELTLTILLARDSVDVYQNPQWQSEKIVIEPGLIRKPSQANWAISLTQDDYHLLQQGALWFGTEISMRPEAELTWNTHQRVITQTHIKVIKRIE